MDPVQYGCVGYGQLFVEVLPKGPVHIIADALSYVPCDGDGLTTDDDSLLCDLQIEVEQNASLNPPTHYSTPT
ncbi:hypothetical protein NL676_013351 [Syzygium grande]|nr:hypothetical protein NL676_013351 [Syzygium grande]